MKNLLQCFLFILSLSSLTLGFSSLNMAEAKTKRKNCKSIEKECLVGGDFFTVKFFGPNFSRESNPQGYCRLLFKSCLKDEMNLDCREVYTHRASVKSKRREKAMNVGWSFLILGAGGGAISLAFSPMTALGMIGVGAGLGGTILGFASIPHSVEKVDNLFQEDDLYPDNFFSASSDEHNKHEKKFIDKINHKIVVTEREIENVFNAKMRSGEFCQHYPRLFSARKVLKSVIDELINLDSVEAPHSQVANGERSNSINMNLPDISNENDATQVQAN